MLNGKRAVAPGPGQNLERTRARDAPKTATAAVPPPKLATFLITEQDPTYVIEFFRVLFSEYPTTEFEPSGVTIEQPFLESMGQSLSRRTKFYSRLGEVDATDRAISNARRRGQYKPQALGLERTRPGPLDVILRMATRSRGSGRRVDHQFRLETDDSPR